MSNDVERDAILRAAGIGDPVAFFTRRPRISMILGIFQCVNCEGVGFGRTMPEAYGDWQKEVLPRRSQIQKELRLLVSP